MNFSWIERQYKKFPASSFIILAALILIFTLSFFIIYGESQNAERIANYAYFFLVIGVLMRIIELKSKTLKKWLDSKKKLVVLTASSFYDYCNKKWKEIKKTRNLTFKIGFVTLVLAMIFIEYAVPLNFVTNVSSIPPEYQWLAKQPGNFIIAEYPMIPEIYSANPFNVSDPYYIFYQQFHEKRLFNGAWNGIGKTVEQYVSNLSNPQTPSILAWYNVSLVIVHYPSNPYQPYNGLLIVQTFPNATIYNITASPSVYWPYKLQQLEKNVNQTTLIP